MAAATAREDATEMWEVLLLIIVFLRLRHLLLRLVLLRLELSARAEALLIPISPTLIPVDSLNCRPKLDLAQDTRIAAAGSSW
jgi:hypothetical protein